jgi:hypothetical protein
MRRAVPILLVLCAMVAAGCDASGETAATRTFTDAAVPFTFEVPSDFTTEPVDEGDTRGDVVAAAGVTKVDVIAVRRLGAGAAPSGAVRHGVQGHAVTSELRPVPGVAGWYLECQYTSERAHKVRDACDRAVATVEPR